jgi:sec-independent protein translocase protein TatB
MFNIGSSEIAVIAVAALLILGPKRLPEMARGIGKFLREFRRQTDEVRNVVEREFYRMDQDLTLEDQATSASTSSTEEPAPALTTAEGTIAAETPPVGDAPVSAETAAQAPSESPAPAEQVATETPSEASPPAHSNANETVAETPSSPKTPLAPAYAKPDTVT